MNRCEEEREEETGKILVDAYKAQKRIPDPRKQGSFRERR